uniref:Uncharacterized protein n=1 Tax=Spongospora subterranea TaxID=70186 RepID=A0A0H5QRA9_9EUKA|eukprot:CRZ04026.1 hypothetical protein [Spongospora subterranea]
MLAFSPSCAFICRSGREDTQAGEDGPSPLSYDIRWRYVWGDDRSAVPSWRAISRRPARHQRELVEFEEYRQRRATQYRLLESADPSSSRQLMISTPTLVQYSKSK